MCGIAGILGGGDHTQAITCMVAAMRHRGPDDNGVWSDSPLPEGSGVRAALGNTRLAIIDLSSAGHMPMADPQTGNSITYNGEIYNFPELRRELESAGDCFRSGSDTEVILRAYARWGAECVLYLRGMFAFAIWDSARRELFLARDRIGKKPLYYCRNTSGQFLFASEIRALLASGLVDRRLDPAALDIYLFNGFMVSPQTMIRDVNSLMPGHWMRVDADGRIVETRRYWRLPPDPAPARRDLQDEIRARLEEAVRRRLISDAPLGAFLSGGLDSSTIVALMARAGGDVRTFSITFDEATYDESSFSNWVARKFGTSHTEVRLRRDQFESWLPDALAAMDQPTFDGLNTYYVSRAARESGLTVALSGAGGDELFGGYAFFRDVPLVLRVGQAARLMPPPFSTALHRWFGRPLFKVSGPLKTLDLLEGARNCPADRLLLAAYQTAQMHFPRRVRDAVLAGAAPRAWFGLPPEFVSFAEEAGANGDRTARLSAYALALFLAERCLRDIDAMSMGVSLEVRAPFTDHLLIESVWQTAGSVRCAGAPDKSFEWGLVRPYLGSDYPYRKKQGFVFPFEEWLRAPAFLEQIRAMLLNASLSERIGLRPQTVREIAGAFSGNTVRVPWSRIWSLFALFHWCERNQVSL